MPELLLASNNKGKLIEIKDLLDDLPVDLLLPADIGLSLDIDENGATYAENAALKGVAYARASGLLTLADDSGLEVEALDGLPGLRSARFSAKPNATDSDRRAYLLEKLQGLARPWTARFRCTVALVTPGEQVHFTEGECPGEIIPDERGYSGFGYDPIFLLPQLGRTMAELSMAEKNQLSHRSRAVKAAIPLLHVLTGL